MAVLRASNSRVLQHGGKLLTTTPEDDGSGTPPVLGDFGLGLIGQSNMYNRQSVSGASGYPLGHPDASEYFGAGTTGTLRRIGNIGTGTFAGADKWGAPSSSYGGNREFVGSQGDGPIMLSGLIAAGLNTRVRVVNRAVIGSSIDSWISIANGGPASNNYWETFAAAVTNLATQLETTPASLLRMVVMQQGETDAHTMTASQWTAKCAIVHAQCKALAGNRSDFLFGVYSLGPGSFNGSTEGEFGKMRAAQVAYATGTSGAFYAGSTYDAATGDVVHIDSPSFNRIDRRAGKAALYALGATSAATGRGGNGAGPRITDATRSGSLITVNISHAGGNALQDGGGGAGAALTGFRVFDGASQVAISATAITSPTTIQLTLASTPSGVVTLDHAMMNVPCGAGANPITFTPAGCVYDNDGYWQYGSASPTALGSPLQPCAAFTVTGS